MPEFRTCRNTHEAEIIVYSYTCFNERYEGRKEGRSKQGQTNNKARQHSTPKAVTFPKKNELPRVGLEPTTLYTLDRALYQLSYQGSTSWYCILNEKARQITHLIGCLGGGMDTLPEKQLPSRVCHSVLVALWSEPDLGDAGGARRPLLGDSTLRPKLPHLH